MMRLRCGRYVEEMAQSAGSTARSLTRSLARSMRLLGSRRWSKSGRMARITLAASELLCYDGRMKCYGRKIRRGGTRPYIRDWTLTGRRSSGHRWREWQ